MNRLTETTYRAQSNFANFCRNEEPVVIEGVIESRLLRYRRMIINTVEDTLKTAFPVTEGFLAEIEWHDLVYKFFSEHRCYSWQVWRLPEEFLTWFKSLATPLKLKYPFLEDLLEIEWIEIEIFMMDDKILSDSSSSGLDADSIVRITPEFKILPLEYPVHLKPPGEIIASEKGNYFVLVFRVPEDGSVQFIDLSPLWVYLIEEISNNNRSVKEIINMTANVTGYTSSDISEKVMEFLNFLKGKKFVI